MRRFACFFYFVYSSFAAAPPKVLYWVKELGAESLSLRVNMVFYLLYNVLQYVCCVIVAAHE